jgi:hypothetical protein
MRYKVILRLFENTAKFDCEGSLEYHDMECNNYQIYQGVLHIMRYSGQDVYVPLTSLKMFKQLSPAEAALYTQEQKDVQVST